MLQRKIKVPVTARSVMTTEGFMWDSSMGDFVCLTATDEDPSDQTEDEDCIMDQLQYRRLLVGRRMDE